MVGCGQGGGLSPAIRRLRKEGLDSLSAAGPWAASWTRAPGGLGESDPDYTTLTSDLESTKAVASRMGCCPEKA